jgi:hypothetical protein
LLVFAKEILLIHILQRERLILEKKKTIKKVKKIKKIKKLKEKMKTVISEKNNF